MITNNWKLCLSQTKSYIDSTYYQQSDSKTDWFHMIGMDLSPATSLLVHSYNSQMIHHQGLPAMHLQIKNTHNIFIK